MHSHPSSIIYILQKITRILALAVLGPILVLLIEMGTPPDGNDDEDEDDGPATEFIRFPELPTEIRFKIWEYSVQERFLVPTVDSLSQEAFDLCDAIAAMSTIPSVLHVNRES